MVQRKSAAVARIARPAVNIRKPLQGLQTGVSGRLSGFEPGQMQDEEMLPD